MRRISVSALDLDDSTRREEFERWWAKGGTNFMRAFPDLLKTIAANDTAAEFVRDKIKQTVKDPEKAEKLRPHTHPIGTKRICVDTQYFETYNRDNVDIIDIQQNPIDEITSTGIVTEGKERQFDSIVFATGFDAMTGALLNVDIRGRGGLTIQQNWSEGPRTYLG